MDYENMPLGDNWLSNVSVELSEDKTRLEMENLVCYYNYPDKKGRQLDYGETPEEQEAALAMAQTLVNMPVKAKYMRNSKGEPTFGGHEQRKLLNGTITYGTEKVGVHTDVRIENRDVTTADGQEMNLPCLIAKQIIWKDAPNVIAAIRRLFSLGLLKTSWEMDVTKEHTDDDGTRHLDEYVFFGNALLGYEYATPCFGTNAEVVMVAAEEEDAGALLADALSRDLIERKENEVKRLNEEKLNAGVGVETQEETAPVVDTASAPPGEENPAVVDVPVATDTPAVDASDAPAVVDTPAVADTAAAENTTVDAGEPATTEEATDGDTTPEQTASTEEATVTDIDVCRSIEHAVAEMYGDGWYLTYLFPEEHKAWFKDGVWPRKLRELEYFQVSYTVDANDNVAVFDAQTVSISLSPVVFEETLAGKDAQIATLESQVAELTPYKEKYETAEAQRLQQEHDTQVAALRQLVLDAGCFSEVELSAEPLANMIDNLQVAEVKAAIFDKQTVKSGAKAEIAGVRTKPMSPRQVLDEDAVVTTKDKVQKFRTYLRKEKGRN